MEFEPEDHARIYDGIDELIKSLNQLLGVSKTVNSMLLKLNFANRGFEQNTEYARRLIAISEDAIRSKNAVMAATLRFYRENTSLRVWERLISRFNSSIMMAYGQSAELLTVRVLSEGSTLDEFFNGVAADNIVAVKKLYKSIFQLELEASPSQRRWSRLMRPSQTLKNSYEMLVYQQGMRIMNQLALGPESSGDLVQRMQDLDIEFDQGLDRNLHNIYKNMMLRNTVVKEAIETYVRDYHDFLTRVHDVSPGEASDVYIEAPDVRMDPRQSRSSKGSQVRQSLLTQLDYFLTQQQQAPAPTPIRKMNRLRTELQTMIIPPDFSIIRSIKSLRRVTEAQIEQTQAKINQAKMSGLSAFNSRRVSRNSMPKTPAQVVKENQAMLVGLTSPFMTNNQKTTIKKQAVQSKRVSISPFSEILGSKLVLPRCFSRRDILRKSPSRSPTARTTRRFQPPTFSNPLQWVSIKNPLGSEQNRRVGLLLKRAPVRIRKRSLQKTFSSLFTEPEQMRVPQSNIFGSIVIKDGENLHLQLQKVEKSARYRDFVRKTEGSDTEELVFAQ